MPNSAIQLDNTVVPPGKRVTLILGGHDDASFTDKVCGINETPLIETPTGWILLFGASAGVLSVLGLMILYLFFNGVGVWNLNNPVGWGFDITNFVFWVGIGHAGTLISAILFLFRQKWRTSINRFAEAMTIFAVICAGMFPGIHIGRVWLAFYLFPIPNQMGVWPNFRSPLLWDVFAVGTYFTVSLLFWYVGLIPDIATLRDRAKHWIAHRIYGTLSLGWTGSARHWHRYEKAYLILAALSTPLVLSVHSIVSFDFAVSQVPGWHTTIFPPYFVAGAIFSGMAMVLTLAIPARAVFKLQDIITLHHIEVMNKCILATGSMVGFAYMMEFFIAWYSGSRYELFAFLNRAMGPYAWAYWIMVTCNIAVPQLFWFKKIRTSIPIIFVISLLVNVGMWFERFVIIVISLSADFLPSAWDTYFPSWVEVLTLIGSFGLFMTLFLLFIRFLPIIAVSEVKGVMAAARHAAHLYDDDHGPGHSPNGAKIPHSPHGSPAELIAGGSH